MAQIDRAKEEIGWLKLLVAIFAAIAVSLIAWLFRNYDTASWPELLMVTLAAVWVSGLLFYFNHRAHRWIESLEYMP